MGVGSGRKKLINHPRSNVCRIRIEQLNFSGFIFFHVLLQVESVTSELCCVAIHTNHDIAKQILLNSIGDLHQRILCYLFG